jgi:hypothetical protein
VTRRLVPVTLPNGGLPLVITAAYTVIRLASASESESVTTKVITNHNHAHALTIRYWQAQRLYDVTTARGGHCTASPVGPVPAAPGPRPARRPARGGRPGETRALGTSNLIEFEGRLFRLL